MFGSFWRDQVGSIADRGRDILRLATGKREPEAGELARRLLAQRGEASGLALAQELARLIRAMSPEALAGFLQTLARDFVGERTAIDEAVARWQRQPDDAALGALRKAVESPRQELFRRLNMAPDGTATLVELRRCLLELLPGHPELRGIDEDMRHLLASWFNRGFLALERIDWNTPAAVLEKLIRYEAVHEIDGWDDLRLRLAADRRCFGFFHPAMPNEPLIFVEVALVDGMSEAIAPLIAKDRAVGDPAEADTAIFYSISNCQDGLRGISFGNFLIKQVVSELQAELPGIKTFATLSPVPGMRRALQDKEAFSQARLEALLGEETWRLLRQNGYVDPIAGLDGLLGAGEPLPAAAQKGLQRLTLAYLTQSRRGAGVADPVAHFHLANGARLERIDVAADLSEKGLRQSFGTMVNYLYEPRSLEENHERYVDTGDVAMPRRLAGDAEEIARLWQPVLAA
ncbi:MAG: malonyl-CoA decarboxylase [Reyranellaceae bacterium]